MKTGSATIRTYAAGVLGFAALALAHPAAHASDHNDSPAAKDDPAADLADLYAWQTDDGRLVLALTFAGTGASDNGGTYDADMLYGFHIDRDGDAISDHDVWARFGQNAAGEWGVQVVGLPESSDPVVGAAASTIETAAGERVWAGPRDDPFFFDFEGHLATLETATIAFDSERDSFAGTNVTAIVLEMDAAMAAGSADEISLWATAGRKE